MVFWVFNESEEMKRILKNDDLIPDEWYWVRSKGGEKMHNGSLSEPGVFVASKVNGGKVKSIMVRMWCDSSNDQALHHYEIYGPIPRPDANLLNN
jgi:hypothetical protein